MGNHRFKLSDMMPNAWFYKLRDMSKIRSHNPTHSTKKNMQSSTPNPRKPFYYTTEPTRMDTKLCLSPRNLKFSDSRSPHEPPRKSMKKQAKRRTVYMPSPRKIAPSEAENSVLPKSGNIGVDPISLDSEDFEKSFLSGLEHEDSFDGPDQYLSSCSCKLSASTSDIIINVDDASYNDTIRIDGLAEFNMILEPDLPPIQTKPGKHIVSVGESVVFHDASVKYQAEKPGRSRRSSTSPGSRKSFSGGVKIRGNGQKLGGKKSEGRRGRNVEEDRKKGMFLSESFAIVKASFDPEIDFRESMMEMIVENNIRASKDLEELLACYLSLNSNQYHDMIIKAFEQIWLSMAQLHF